MKKTLFILVWATSVATAYFTGNFEYRYRGAPLPEQKSYWLVLHRKSNTEYLYKGIPGDTGRSTLVRQFEVKTGISGERPTPLPQLMNREYWLITAKEKSGSQETAPYFIALDVPAPPQEPYGPVPYNECGGQCNWVVPGAFGLHGINGDLSRISENNAGSSGCVRHRDEDITYLFNVLDPSAGEIRYYVADI